MDNRKFVWNWEFSLSSLSSLSVPGRSTFLVKWVECDCDALARLQIQCLDGLCPSTDDTSRSRKAATERNGHFKENKTRKILQWTLYKIEVMLWSDIGLWVRFHQVLDSSASLPVTNLIWQHFVLLKVFIFSRAYIGKSNHRKSSSESHLHPVPVRVRGQSQPVTRKTRK